LHQLRHDQRLALATCACLALFVDLNCNIEIVGANQLLSRRSDPGQNAHH
jgi:hypothetical protein